LFALDGPARFTPYSFRDIALLSGTFFTGKARRWGGRGDNAISPKIIVDEFVKLLYI
jgi:hypothetical protein